MAKLRFTKQTNFVSLACETLGCEFHGQVVHIPMAMKHHFLVMENYVCSGCGQEPQNKATW